MDGSAVYLLRRRRCRRCARARGARALAASCEETALAAEADPPGACSLLTCRSRSAWGGAGWWAPGSSGARPGGGRVQ